MHIFLTITCLSSHGVEVQCDRERDGFVGSIPTRKMKYFIFLFLVLSSDVGVCAVLSSAIQHAMPPKILTLGISPAYPAV